MIRIIFCIGMFYLLDKNIDMINKIIKEIKEILRSVAKAPPRLEPGYTPSVIMVRKYRIEVAYVWTKNGN